MTDFQPKTGEKTMEEYKKFDSLHEIFACQASKTPDNVAVVSFDGRKVSYKELDDWTDTLSYWLIMKGVAVESLVGIYMERCLEYTVAYIAILKAGGAYMPMDPSYPQPLVGDILRDAKPAMVLTKKDLAVILPGGMTMLACEGDWMETVKRELSEIGFVPVRPNVNLDNLAYTVYSSGTTGKPKGIQCTHQGAVFSYTWRAINFPYRPGDREACNVFFVWEMLRPLLKGATLYIISDNIIYDPRLLCEYLFKNEITRMLFTPSLFEAILDTEGLEVAHYMKSLRTVIFCGEVVTVGFFERCMKTLDWIQFVNLYSISEAHDVACADLTQWYHQNKASLQTKKFCTVGQLLTGVQVAILDDQLQPQPMGVAGEIYIGGPTLARGYLNRPELNKERFIARPEAVPVRFGERLYKAGDWGYMLSGGSFEICGRCDSMVKIRGYSIETQAVEAALLDLDLVNACVVLVVGEEGEDKHLVAYIVPEGDTSKKAIRAALKKRLPFYMIPSYFVFLSCIPILASSGKLDKKALPLVNLDPEEIDMEGQPTTDTEQQLAEIWGQVLRLRQIDVQESFFDLGGHSLLATKLLNKVEEQFGVTLAVKDLFIHSTIASMAKLVDNRLNKGSAEDVIEPVLDLALDVDIHDQAVFNIDIQLRAFWRSMQYKDKWRKGRVLLTGATGFLGAFLLRDLLNNTKSDVFCIVREMPEKKCEDRVRAALTLFGILDPDSNKASEDKQLMEARFKARVTVIAGDVGLNYMGLTEEDYNYLSTEIDFIIHAAAVVNLIYPYKVLHGPNVLGTQNVVKFACTSKIKPLHYISTDAVFPHGLSGCQEDDDMSQLATQLVDGYSQSKWVAEQLVKRAMDRGLPAIIYRLGNLSGESQTAHWNPQDFNLLMLQACARLGEAPDVSWEVEMTPVDFVSNLVVSLSQNTFMALGKILHVINTKPLKANWLYEWMSAHGHPVDIVPFEEWKQNVVSNQKVLKDGGLLARLLDIMITDEKFFAELSTYRQDNLLSVLHSLGLNYPQLNSGLLSKYFYQLERRRILPRAHKNTLMDRPLEGRVAVVTGASSGIGAAVAQHLARAGAHVAMAARRDDRLTDLKKVIQADGGVAIAVKCDVMDRDQVTNLVHHTESTLGPVDILVNNAGVMYYTMMKNLKEEEWHRQVDLNCKGVLNCIGAVLDGMLQRKKGHIINMSSNAGRRGFAGLAVYSGTKFFVEGLSQGMRTELAKTGVKVTCVQPGDVQTELVSHTSDKEAKDLFDGSESTKVLEPDDIARAVVYAATQPDYAAVNEILIEPREAPI